ncbi:hypothetical protein CHS0354_019590 [Potamilus streckersoni]|uniref:TIR domain-containing protein n=1 Tax=Potamilus streckersoni TaxID=2493646 RepID=A0AAE0TFV0_9BIVA|nr:hypothetical protein CHS0354_019590 [Potamilus streckersoni]
MRKFFHRICHYSLGFVNSILVFREISKRDQTCEFDKWSVQRNDFELCGYFPDGSTQHQLQDLEVIDIGGSNDCHKINAFYCAQETQCFFPDRNGLRELYLDHICIIRFDMLFGGLNRLEKLDFSSNLCEYLSFLVFSSMLSLKTLLLNGNSLSKMEENDPEELRILFRENRNLQFLNLSANGFSRLPSNIFATNTKLEVLDISKNVLLNTDWLTSVHLRSVILTENRIMTIDTRTRQIIEDSANGYKYSIVQVTGIHLTLASNPITCSCDQEEMLLWLSNNKRYVIDINEIVCAETGRFISTYTDDIDTYLHVCEFQRYKSLFALFTIPVITTIVVVLYIRHYRHILRIRRIRKQLEEFVEDNVHVKHTFLLYLAYSLSDSDMVLSKIFPVLESRLQKEVGINGNLVCISDRDFDVGVSISDEIINAVSSSSAVLFIISKEFARSRWCEFEAEIALYQRKPIILVTVGHVRIRSLPASLKKVCFKWTRLEWPGTENQDKLEGFWKRLVTAIIKYTADVAQVNETQL